MDSINNSCKFGGDAWLELQAFKTRQLNRREKLNRHKDIINGITQKSNLQTASLNATNGAISSASANIFNNCTTSACNTSKSNQNNDTVFNNGTDSVDGETQHNAKTFNPGESSKSHDLDQSNIQASDHTAISVDTVECLLLLKLCDVALKLPIDSKSLQRSICKVRGFESTSPLLIENLLQKFAHQELITIEEPANITDESCFYVTSADHTKLVDFDKCFGRLDSIRGLLSESKSDEPSTEDFDFGNHSVPIQAVRNVSSRQFNTISSNQEAGEEQNNQTINNVDSDDNQCIKTIRHRSSDHNSNSKTGPADDDLESLLSLSSTRERESKKLGEELLELLSKPTAKEKNLMESFRSADGYQVQEFCPKGTKGECRRNSKNSKACNKLHFKKIIAKHTEESLGDCSFLNTCFHMDSCKYVHYEVDYDNKSDQMKLFKKPYPAEQQANRDGSTRANHDQKQRTQNQSSSQVQHQVPSANDSNNNRLSIKSASNSPNSSTSSLVSTSSLPEPIPYDQSAKTLKRFKTVLCPPQWIQCDLRFFDMSLLGKFSVVMADPPWDIHMELPYGTMSDDEMRKLNIPTLQDEGVIFLWVTGRAMELGRECLALWGYERCDEIIWVKTNQLQRIIRTGRTGHWLNHGKEHCLVGVKGNPKDINRGLDCDVIVAEVRATSHKPDEIYGIIERLSPGTRKIELFGRAHNVQPNWITLGNQLDGVHLIEPSLMNAFRKQNLPFQTATDGK